MWGSMYPTETERALVDRSLNPKPLPAPEPGMWAKAGALVSAPYTGFAQALNESGRVAYRVLNWQPDIEPLIDWRKVGIDTDALGKAKRLRDDEADQAMRSAADYWKPDAATSSWASNFLHEGARILTKAGAYSAMGGAPGAIVGTGLDEGATSYLSLRDRGVDPTTAAKVGVTHGAAMAASIALPVAGRTGLQTAGLVGVGGPGMYIGEQMLSRNILENARYPDLAREFDPWDPVGLATSLVPGAAVGAAVHVARSRKAKAAPDPAQERAAEVQALADTPEAVEAAHIQYRQDVVDANMLAAPDDLAARADHQRALQEASQALDEGRPMELGDIRVDPARAEAAVAEMRQRLEAVRVDAPPAEPAVFKPGALERAEVRTAREAWEAMLAGREPEPGNLEPGAYFAAQNLMAGLREVKLRMEDGEALLAEYTRRADEDQAFGRGTFLGDIAADVVQDRRDGITRPAWRDQPELTPMQRAERIVAGGKDFYVRLDENGPTESARNIVRTGRAVAAREMTEARRAIEVAIECALKLGD